MVDDSSREEEEEERRTREIQERKELQKHQMEIFGCCSPDLSFPLPSRKRYESKDVFIAQNFPRVPLDKSEGVVKHRDFLWRCGSIALSTEQVRTKTLETHAESHFGGNAFHQPSIRPNHRP
jgi:hypothetical protein